MTRRTADAPPEVSVRELCAAALRDAATGPGAGLTARCEEALRRAATPAEATCALDALVAIGERHGWLREARAALERLAVDSPRRREDLARLLARGWLFSEALDALGPGADVALLRADLLTADGRVDEALAALGAAPEGADLDGRLAALGRHDLAAAHAPDGVTAARVALWRGDLDRAMARAEALRLDTLRGAVHARRGEVDAALDALDLALRANPRDAEARCWRAEVLLRAGRHEDALLEALRAGECSPEFTQYIPAQLLRYRAESALGRLGVVPRGPVSDALAALLPGRESALREALYDAPSPRPPARADEVRSLLDTALARLDAVDATRWLRLARALLREGRDDDARTEAERVRQRSVGDARIAAEVVVLRCDLDAGRFAGFTDAALAARLRALSPQHADTIARATPAAPGGREARAATLLDEALAALGGNRTVSPVFVRDGALLPLPVDAAPRLAAKHALWRVTVGGDEAALAALAEAVARFPRSPEPHLYVGELHLWFGRWTEARAAFERALTLQRHTRWAWIGLGAAALGRGDPAGALETFARGERVSGGVGPTLYAYRGEALWRIGDLARAEADLAHACRQTPRRISAWMLRALVADAAGDVVLRDEAAAEVRARAPGLVADAADACDAALTDRGAALPVETLRRVLLTALTMMRGNRSSNYPTYHLADGRLRVATTEPDEAGDAALGARAAALAAGG